ncbi:MAG: SCO family protein [Acetobacteraceae bacterium]|nr:SCO family protein [Acetobacteraceae bacterium]
MLRIIRYTALALSLLLLAAGGVLWWQRGSIDPQSVLGGMSVPPGVSVGGPFELVDQNGKPVSERDFRGRFMLLFFGFTHCPDVCPTELQVLADVLEQLGPRAARVAPIFVTVDPERDTPAVLAEYVKLFDPRLIGLTGTEAQIAAMAKAYRVYYAKVTPPGASTYLMNHSSFVYLMGPDGAFRGLFRYGTPAEEIARAITAGLPNA